jgi:hypothetical protein
MKKTYTLFLGFLLSMSLTLHAQFVAESVNFDNYVSPTDNDLQNHFYNSGLGMNLTAIPTNGITGGCLLPGDTNIWGNDNATYCSKLQGGIGFGGGVAISFKYDTSQIHTNHFERPVSIWLVPSSDWNHYVIGTISRAKKFEQISYSWVNPTSPTLPLQHGYWYKFNISISFTGGVTGDQVDVTSNAFNLGTSGTDPQILIGSYSGSFNDSILVADSAISVSINGARWGGAIYLDNFEFEGYKSSDSCTTPVGINESSIGNPDLNYSIKDNMLHVFCDHDYDNGVLEIMNVSGQKLRTSKLTAASSDIDLSEFSNGLYFLTVRTLKKNTAFKFVLSR